MRLMYWATVCRRAPGRAPEIASAAATSTETGVVTDVVTGCREVVVQGDHLFARFEAKLVRARVTTGEVKIKILLPNGGEVERIFKAPGNFMVTTSKGGRYRIFELERGEVMDILISDKSFALASIDEKGSITIAPPMT